MLREVEAEACLLDPRKSMGGQGGTRPSGLASQQSPVRLDALVLSTHYRGSGRVGADDADPLGVDDTGSVLETLHSWAATVRAERWLAIPTVHLSERWPWAAEGPYCEPWCAHPSCHDIAWRKLIPARPTIASERDLLTRQLTWIVGQPMVADLHAQLRDLLAQLRRVNGTADTPAGRCSSLQPDATECGGTIRHIELEHDDGPPEPGFRCGRCRRVWTGTEAVRLRHQLWLDEQGQTTDDERIGA